MNVLTVSRQMGCGGDEIARTIAQTLQWEYMDHALINRAAREADVPEVALAHIDEFDLLGLRPSPQEHRAYLNQVERIIHELADKGNVIIVGCAAQMVLAGNLEALHIQIIAPIEVRIAHLMQQEAIPEAAAMERLLAGDKKRAKYLKTDYGVDWLDSSLYDVVVNTAKIQQDAIIRCLIQCLQVA
jgi:cytidylate kinase